MKKFLTICMALLVTGLAGSAFAQEVKTEEKKGPAFTYGLKGAVFGVTGAQKDFEYDYAHIRVRPTFSLSNENVKAVVTFEIDQDFGKDSAGAAGYADPGTDNIVAEVKHAYLEVKDAAGITGLSLMSGLNGYKFPIVVDNDFAIGQVGYDFGMGKAIVSYIKIEESSAIENTAANAEQKTDAEAYALDLPVKLGTITVRPGVIAIKGGKASTLAETSLLNYALNVNADMGMVAFNATGAYLTGDQNSTVETSAFAIDANVDIKPVENVKAGLFFTYGTGNDGKDAAKDNGYFNNMNRVFGSNVSAADALKGKTSSGAPDGRLFLLENASLASGGGLNYFDVMDNDSGYMSYGIYAEAKLDKLTAFAQFGMATLTEKNSAGKTAIGSEIDLKVSYEVAPKTMVFAEYANFIASDVIIGANTTSSENAYQFAMGMTTSI